MEQKTVPTAAAGNVHIDSQSMSAAVWHCMRLGLTAADSDTHRRLSRQDVGMQVMHAAHAAAPYISVLQALQNCNCADTSVFPAGALQDHGRLKDKSNLGVPPVSRVEMVQRTNLWGYQPGGARPFLKITCALPNLVTSCRSKQQKAVAIFAD